MHMGAMASVGQNASSNFKHIIFNNGVHDSVGAQPTDAANSSFSFPQIALACGYKAVKKNIFFKKLQQIISNQDFILLNKAFVAINAEEIKSGLDKLRSTEGPVLLEIKCNPGHRKNLGRPTTKPIDNKSDFMHFLALN